MLPSEFKAIKALAETLRAELDALRQVSREQVSAIRDNEKAAYEGREKIERAIAAVQTPEADRAHERTYREKNYTVQVVLTVVTGLAFLAAATYAGLARRQVCIMNRTYAEIQKQTKAAQDSVVAAKQANTDATQRFRQDQRPYIWQTNGSSTGPKWIPNQERPGWGQFIWDWHITNYGKSPAYDATYSETINIGKGFVPTFGKFHTVFAGAMVPNYDTFHTIVSAPMTQADAASLVGKDEAISVKIVIEYKDVYGTPYETGLCLSHLRSNAIENCKDSYVK